jgi:23S rRNA (adenine2503-C2)-methyltransferase
MIDIFIKEHRLPLFRIKQFNLAYYKDFIVSFDELTTWSKELREKLKKTVSFSTITPIKEIESADHRTGKVLFSRISDEKCFESVIMKHKDGRNTVCVSCMIGCPVRCVFCATGKMKFVGNLTAREIVDQVLYFARILKQQKQLITNIVFMGMGEPLLNLEQVMDAVKILNNKELMGFGIRRITISTSGITPKIYELMKLGYKGRLAFSLHAPDQKLRESLMPIAKKYPLPELIFAMKAFATRTQLRISYEYILIDGINDQPDQARALVNLVGKKDSDLVHINLIPYNPIAGVSFKRSPLKSVYAFAKILTDYGISNTFRVTMGDDIKAACGQLTTQ